MLYRGNRRILNKEIINVGYNSIDLVYPIVFYFTSVPITTPPPPIELSLSPQTSTPPPRPSLRLPFHSFPLPYSLQEGGLIPCPPRLLKAQYISPTYFILMLVQSAQSLPLVHTALILGLNLIPIYLF